MSSIFGKWKIALAIGGTALVSLLVWGALIGEVIPVGFGLWSIPAKTATITVPPAGPALVTEASFAKTIVGSRTSDLGREWLASRADHRVLVDTILLCKKKEGLINAMSPGTFSALLLDLTPDGNHLLPETGDSLPHPGGPPTATSTAAWRGEPGPTGDAAVARLTPALLLSPVAAPQTWHDAAVPGTAGRVVTAQARKSAQPTGAPPSSRGTAAADTKPSSDLAPADSPGSQSSGTDAALGLTPDEWRLLSLSDTVARNRLLAVWQETEAKGPADDLWWFTLVISGFSTLFVTLQAKMRSPDNIPDPTPKPEVRATGSDPSDGGSSAAADGDATVVAIKDPALQTWQAAERQRRRLVSRKRSYDVVAFITIVLSITVTSLTAIKQYYDPIRAVSQNEQVLRDLRQMHQEIVLAAVCEKGGNTVSPRDKSGTDWDSKLKAAVVHIISPYSASTGSDTQSH